MFPTVSIHHQFTALPDTVLHQFPYTHSPLTGRRTTAQDPRGKQEVDPVEMDPTSDSPVLSDDTNTCPRKNIFLDRTAARLTYPESNQMKNYSWLEKRSYMATLREYPLNVSFFVSILYCDMSIQNIHCVVSRSLGGISSWIKRYIFSY